MMREEDTRSERGAAFFGGPELDPLDAILAAFEDAWQQGSPPSLASFLNTQPLGDRRTLLHELIGVDLEYRWRRAGSSGQGAKANNSAETLPHVPVVTPPESALSPRPRLEDYLVHHVELGTRDELPLTLIAEEYRVRQRWGDRPAIAEYLNRFPAHPELPTALARVDVELRTEKSVGDVAADQTVRQPRPSLRAPAEVPRRLAEGSLPDLPDYEFLEVLGQGGMGVVYKARQRSLNRLVAVKMVLTGAQANRAERQRFRREAEAVARLQHPNIVQIHEVGEHEGRPYLVLEYISGGSLAARLAVTPMQTRAAAELLATLARAVQHAHDQDFVHRDLKPANILVQDVPSSKVQSSKSPENRDVGLPKIADFGLVKDLGAETENQTMTGAIVGTPGYMAPEQAAGQSQQIGPATDVYALGAILYEAVTGRPPFKAASVFETLEQVRYAEPVPPRRLQPNVPRDLETICLTCLRKEPGKRYASAAALADDLQRFLDGKPILARPVGLAERFWKWARRRPAVAGLFLALVLVVVGAFVGITALWRQADIERLAAVDARSMAEQQRDTARSEKARADERYRQARKAMNQMLARLDDRRLAATPRLKELYEAQLEDAVAFYEGLLRESGPLDPLVQRDVAGALEQAGVIQAKLSLVPQARKSFHRAVDLWQNLIARFPAALDDQAELAVCYSGLGMVEGKDWSQKALTMREQLCRARPNNAAWQEALAESYHNLAAGYQQAGDVNAATAFFEKALAILISLHHQSPKDPSPPTEAANNCAALGLCYMARNEPDRAEAIFRQGEALLGPIVQRVPNDSDRALFLASLYINWAVLERSMKHQVDSAAALAGHAIDLTEGIIRREPRYSQAAQACVSAHGEHAYASDRPGHYAAAIHDWDRAIELSDEAGRPRFRALRGWILIHAGDPTQAATVAAQLAADPKTPQAILFEAAKMAASAGDKAWKDPALDPSRRKLEAEADAALAIHLLERLRQAGTFKNPWDVWMLRQETAFDWLRTRDEFRKLQRAIEHGKVTR